MEWLNFSSLDHKISKSIGIGRGLAAPSLPHHRAYGSVHGGSMDISGSVLGLTAPVRVERRARSGAHSRVRAIN